MMDEPGTFFRTMASVFVLTAMNDAQVPSRMRTRRSVAEPLAVAGLFCMAVVRASTPQMKSRRRKMRTARARMKTV